MTTESQSSSPSRRTFLRGVAAGAVATSMGMSGCIGFLGGGHQQQVHDGLKQARMPFASQQQRITKDQATHVVSDRSQLVEAVMTPEATVWLPGNVEIDLTGSPSIPVAPNVTIASNRGLDDGAGGVIKTDEYDHGLLIADDGSCRVTGIQLQGPRNDYFDVPLADLDSYSSVGIKLRGQRAIVDHCEVYGWTFAGVLLGSNSTATQGWVHHNSMHHNQMNHLGYPVELYNGVHLIEWNTFDHNRHSIAGFGYWTNGYEARYNLVGPNAILHAFDMHHLGENLDHVSESKGMRGGKFVNIHHNVFTLTDHAAFSIQGYPKQFARFANNWCATSDRAVFALPDADFQMQDNSYGEQAVEQGQQWLQEQAQSATQDSQNASNVSAQPQNQTQTGLGGSQ